jgi:hypothetical protein
MTGFPVSDADIVALKITLLREFAALPAPRIALGDIALKHKMTADDIRALVVNHGWPVPAAMARAADVLAGKQAPAPAPRPTPAPVQPAPDPDPDPPQGTDRAYERLLTAGEHSTYPRTRDLATNIRALVDQLKHRVADEQAIADLEHELAAKKAALHGDPADPATQLAEPPAPTTTSAAIRAWAATNGIDCPAHGRIPTAVRTQYDAAQQAGAA